MSLKTAFGSRFKMGAAISRKNLNTKQRTDLLLKEFNSFTCENDMKPMFFLDEEENLKDPSKYNLSPKLRFDIAVPYLEFAKENNIHLIQTDTEHRIIRIEDKTYGIQRVNAYHNKLKGFLRQFHGVSTKHLGNYIVWNNLMMCSHRKQEELKEQLIGQLLKVRMTLYCRDISGRPPLPTAV